MSKSFQVVQIKTPCASFLFIITGPNCVFSHSITEKFLHMQNNQLALVHKLVQQEMRIWWLFRVSFTCKFFCYLLILCDIIYIVAQKQHIGLKFSVLHVKIMRKRHCFLSLTLGQVTSECDRVLLYNKYFFHSAGQHLVSYYGAIAIILWYIIRLQDF